MPLPLAPEERVGQVLEMLPALAWGIIPSTGGEHMQMGMVLPITPMRVEHGDIPPLEGLPLDGTVEVLQTLRPALPEGTQYERSAAIEGGTDHRRDRQQDMPIHDPLVQYFTHLTDPVIHRGLRTPQ